LAEGSGAESSSPPYGSLRESQLAGRFLDGPSSYRDRSGQIKWHQKVRFQSQPQQMSLEDRMQELREQQQQEQPSALSSMLATSVTLHDQDSIFNKDDEAHLSTSLTGLELLQRGLSTSTDVPDASIVSSFSSSNVTYEAPMYETCDGTPYEASVEPLHGDYYDHEEEDDIPVFDLDME
jgi:hypothetical protein